MTIDPQYGGAMIKEKEGDPFMLLEEYIETRKLRLVDIFRQLDVDGSGKISGEELRNGASIL